MSMNGPLQAGICFKKIVLRSLLPKVALAKSWMSQEKSVSACFH